MFCKLLTEVLVEMLVWEQGLEEGQPKIEWEDIGDFIHDDFSEAGDLPLLAIQHTQDPIKFRVYVQKLL